MFFRRYWKLARESGPEEVSDKYLKIHHSESKKERNESRDSSCEGIVKAELKGTRN